MKVFSPFEGWAAGDGPCGGFGRVSARVGASFFWRKISSLYSPFISMMMFWVWSGEGSEESSSRLLKELLSMS
jgi:hypothetical protein